MNYLAKTNFLLLSIRKQGTLVKCEVIKL